jgi:hypothetical protein
MVICEVRIALVRAAFEAGASAYLPTHAVAISLGMVADVRSGVPRTLFDLP